MKVFRLWLAALCAILAAAFSAIPAHAGEVVWWAPNWGEARARDLAKRFMDANPGITVKVEVTVANGLPERVLTALRSGAAPDIIEVQHGWVNNYAQTDLILPLDDTIQETADYVKAALEYVNWNGKTWAIPYRIETHGVIFNRAHFREAGLDPDKPPQTWDQLVAAAKALTRSGRFGFGITGGGEVGNTIFRSLPFVWMAGGDLISADGKTALINKPEAIRAIEFYTNFHKLGLAPRSTLENDGLALRRLFVAGTLSAYQSGQFDIPAIRNENGNLDIGAMPIPYPEGKARAAILGGWSFVLPKAARNAAEARKFLQFINTSDNQGFYTDTFPARISSLKLPRFQDPILKPFAEMLPFGRPVPVHRNWVKMTQAYLDGIQRILLGDQTVQKSMDQTAEEIQVLLR
jgi:multiple sugar transport system substrate-binding protein